MTLENHPQFQSIVELIISQNPLQKKRIEAFCAEQDETYWRFAEDLSQTLNNGFLLTSENREEAAKSYNKMCMDFLREQIKFRKTGEYTITDSAIAEKHVYNDLDVMRYYMIGLLISYMLWPNHYKLFRFFLDNLPKHPIKKYLEVGVGHGLFSSTLLTAYPDIQGTGIDISETSIQIAENMLNTFSVDTDRLHFIHSDYLKAEIAPGQFDFIIMGEVLEHVNNAPDFMARTKQLLAPGGSVYLSTCANCPALDHVYRFHCAKEIRSLIVDSGFKIVSDLALPADAVPEEDWAKELTTINYCCLLEHA